MTAAGGCKSSARVLRCAHSTERKRPRVCGRGFGGWGEDEVQEASSKQRARAANSDDKVCACLLLFSASRCPLSKASPDPGWRSFAGRELPEPPGYQLRLVCSDNRQPLVQISTRLFRCYDEMCVCMIVLCRS